MWLARTGIISSGSKTPLILDTLAGLGATANFAVSNRKLRAYYSGPAFTAYNLTNSAVGTVAFFNGVEVTDSSTVTITSAGSSGYTVGQTMAYSTFKGSATIAVVHFDQSLSANHPTQTTPGNRPRVTNAGTNEIMSNGKMGIRFVAANSHFWNVANIGSASALWGNVVFKITVNPPVANNGPVLGDFGSSTNACHWPWTDGSMYDDFGRNARYTVGALSPNLAANTVMSIVANSSGYEVFTNGVSRYSTVSGAFGISGGAHRIGSSNLGGGYYWEGTVGEIMMFKTSPSSTVRQTLELDQKAFFGTP